MATERLDTPDPSGDGPALGGLAEEEAAARLTADGPNELPRPPSPSVGRRAARQLADPLCLVLLAAALASVVILGQTAEGLAIAAIVVLNVAIGTAQEQRAADAGAALERLTAPTARVRRSGRTTVVPAHDVVVGDLVEIDAGDRVPADVELVEAAGLAVDEAVLTGESEPAEKRAAGPAQPGTPPVDRPGEAFAGTLAVRGRAVGRVVRTGARTEVGAIATGLGEGASPPLVGELRRVAARMSVLAVLLGAVLIPVVLVRSGDGPDPVATAVLAGVALAVAAIPEGLATIVTSSLALGARRMAGHGAIVRRLPAIEALGGADVICTDKTGTITTGRITVADVAIPGGGDRAFWEACWRCRDGDADPVDAALGVAARAAGFDEPPGTRVAGRPFDATTRSMTTVHEVHGMPVLSVKGAPEVVLPRCAAGPDRAGLEAAVDRLSGAGLRVLAVASGETADLDATDLDARGLVAFHDPLRPSAVEAIAACRAAGVRVVLVTGDHAATARAIATAAGIEDGPTVTGAGLAAHPEADRDDLLRAAAVVARVEPATKVALVEAHQAAGRVVAMTGDGVNDAPALRRADVGVALADVGGTDVARAAAEVVLTDGDLATLVTAVREGRRIYGNLRAVVSYLVTGNLSEILTVALALALLPGLAVPLLPVQLLWVNLVTDGLPALALGVDHPATDPLRATPRGRDERLLPVRRMAGLAGRSVAIAVVAVATGLLGEHAWGWEPDVVRTQVLLTLVVAHQLLAYTARARRWSFEAGWWRNRV
ncbi:MAG: cation-translocating P-type ATPase, partial [Acidimicrobiia bacterium]